MMTALLLLIQATANQATASQATASQAPDTGDIVVVAAPRNKCRTQRGSQRLSDRELDRYAQAWAKDREIRIFVQPGASYRCMSKIMFRLAERGVTRATFVDAPAQ